MIVVMQERYLKASKKLKRQFLDEYSRLTGYNRAYASILLRHYKPALMGKEKAQSPSSGKKTVTFYYDGKVNGAQLISVPSVSRRAFEKKVCIGR